MRTLALSTFWVRVQMQAQKPNLDHCILLSTTKCVMCTAHFWLLCPHLGILFGCWGSLTLVKTGLVKDKKHHIQTHRCCSFQGYCGSQISKTFTRLRVHILHTCFDWSLLFYRVYWNFYGVILLTLYSSTITEDTCMMFRCHGLEN